MFIVTHKITEDNLTLPDGGLHTFSSNIFVTFFELYTVLLLLFAFHSKTRPDKSYHGFKKCLETLLHA